MAKSIGPTFPTELEAAGLIGLPFAWSSEGIFCWDKAMTQEQIDAVLAVYDAHDPTLTEVPVLISDRQFATGLKLHGVMSHNDALAFSRTGVLPQFVNDALAVITDKSQRETAELYLSGSTVFERTHEVIAWFGTVLAWTPAQLDDFWRQAAKL